MVARILVTPVLLIGGGWLVAGLLAAPKPTGTSDPVTEKERKYLVALHRNTVEVFVDRPGFGVRRLFQPYDDVINAPKPLQSNDQGSIVEPEKPKVDPKKPAKDKDAHYTFEDTIRKSLRGHPATETRQWNVRKVQLVGLTKNPKPVVYNADKVPGMKGVKDIPTRELDAFEKQALEALKSGDNLQVERRGAEMRAMGPIYAGKQCLACHDNPGELLGAFTYVLERGPLKTAE